MPTTVDLADRQARDRCRDSSITGPWPCRRRCGGGARLRRRRLGEDLAQHLVARAVRPAGRRWPAAGPCRRRRAPTGRCAMRTTMAPRALAALSGVRRARCRRRCRDWRWARRARPGTGRRRAPAPARCAGAGRRRACTPLRRSACRSRRAARRIMSWAPAALAARMIGLGVGCGRHAGDVLGDGAVEQFERLRHVADMGAERCRDATGRGRRRRGGRCRGPAARCRPGRRKSEVLPEPLGPMTPSASPACEIEGGRWRPGACPPGRHGESVDHKAREGRGRAVWPAPCRPWRGPRESRATLSRAAMKLRQLAIAVSSGASARPIIIEAAIMARASIRPAITSQAPTPSIADCSRSRRTFETLPCERDHIGGVARRPRDSAGWPWPSAPTRPAPCPSRSTVSPLRRGRPRSSPPAPSRPLRDRPRPVRGSRARSAA